MNRYQNIALLALTGLAFPVAAQVPKLPTPTMLPRVPLANEPSAKPAVPIPTAPSAVISTTPRKHAAKPKPKRQRPQAHGPTSQVNKANGSALREPTGFGYLNVPAFPSGRPRAHQRAPAGVDQRAGNVKLFAQHFHGLVLRITLRDTADIQFHPGL